MTEIQSGPEIAKKARPGDASFFTGREGLLLPKGLLDEPDFGSPVQPIANLFDIMQKIWELNGHQIGKATREEALDLPASGIHPALTLRSSYRGFTDEELPSADIRLHGRGGMRPLPWRDCLGQGVEHFVVSLSESRPLNRYGKTAPGKPYVMASRSYRFRLAGGAEEGASNGARTTLAAANNEDAGPAKPILEPDTGNETTYIFLGGRRVYPDFAIPGRQVLRVFAGLPLPEELTRKLSADRNPAESYQAWLSHFVVRELLAG